MTEALTIDCPELSHVSGNFISARSCKIYRDLNDCPESCLQHPKFSRIVTTLPHAATSPPNTEASTPGTNTEHPGEPKKKKGRGSNQKPVRWCPDLEKQVYEVSCQRRYRGNYCLKQCEHKTQLDEKTKARELKKMETENASGLDWAAIEKLLCQYPAVLERLREMAAKELREPEAQLVWELMMNWGLAIEEKS